MSYLYHLRPEPFKGTSLVPLNSMDKESELYKKHSQKYVGREDLMDGVIPNLNCKWNDVVQFSALDPQIIVNELKKYQCNLRLIRPSYFKVHIDEIISKYDAVIFDRRSSKGKGDFKIEEDEVKLLTKENYEELLEVPEETINFWKKAKVEGGKFLWFPYVTHIMVRGIIETKDFEICELKL